MGAWDDIGNGQIYREDVGRVREETFPEADNKRIGAWSGNEQIWVGEPGMLIALSGSNIVKE